ncbi:MAG: zinc ABC transporter substrate-binding protein, partial [Dehalococcoidia bacterium]|nr:zinc ABC transporter substrate-binding protein [Dehalococcoidia bacterium]
HDDHDKEEGHDDHDDHEDHDDHDDHEGHDDHDKEEGHDDHDDHEGHDHGGVDPHFFTDPGRMAQAVEQLSEFLVLNFPEVDEKDLVSNMTNYSKKLEDLDNEVMQTLSSISADSRVLITNHQVFAYFAESYEFEILGTIIPTASTLSNTSAKDLVDLAEKMKDEGVKAIFVDNSSSDALANALAGELDGVEVVNLFSESLGPEDSAGSTYIDMVRTNSELIAGALTR